MAVLQPLAATVSRLEPGEKPASGAESRLARKLATAVLNGLASQFGTMPSLAAATLAAAE